MRSVCDQPTATAFSNVRKQSVRHAGDAIEPGTYEGPETWGAITAQPVQFQLTERRFGFCGGYGGRCWSPEQGGSLQVFGRAFKGRIEDLQKLQADPNDQDAFREVVHAMAQPLRWQTVEVQFKYKDGSPKSLLGHRPKIVFVTLPEDLI